MTKFTEGENTYRIVPIILKKRNADTLIANLIERGKQISKPELVPLTLVSLMDGVLPQRSESKLHIISSKK